MDCPDKVWIFTAEQNHTLIWLGCWQLCHSHCKWGAAEKRKHVITKSK